MELKQVKARRLLVDRIRVVHVLEDVRLRVADVFVAPPGPLGMTGTTLKKRGNVKRKKDVINCN